MGQDNKMNTSKTFSKKRKICYVLPRYDSADATHFSHVHDFLRAVSGGIDIFLVIERGETPEKNIMVSRARKISSSFFPLRLVETIILFLWARISGCSVVYVHYSFFAAFLASLIFRPLGGRVYYWNCGEPWKYKRSFLRGIFERLVYKMVTYHVTGARPLARRYATEYNFSQSKSKILPNWIDLARFSVSLDKYSARKKLFLDSKYVVLFVHRLSPRKGADLIVPTAKIVLKKEPGTIFIVIGDGPHKNEIEKEVLSDLDLKNHIKILGAIPNKEIPIYFRSADVFFMPSEEEGFPRVLLESMALGTSFVASDVGAVSGIVPEETKKYIVKDGTPEKYASALVEIIRGGAGQISSVFPKHIAQFDVHSVAHRFLEMVV